MKYYLYEFRPEGIKMKSGQIVLVKVIIVVILDTC